MRFLYLVLAVFLLVSLANSGYREAEAYHTEFRFCSTKCNKVGSCSKYWKCKLCCSLMPGWKGK